MDITIVRVQPRLVKDKVLAECRVVLDEVFVLKHVKVIDGKDGLFVTMPSIINDKFKYDEAYHCVDSDFFKYFKREVLAAYHQYKDLGLQVYKPEGYNGSIHTNSLRFSQTTGK